MSASTKQVPLWPGEEEALRPQAPQTLKLDPWKLSVLEDMIELNSSPSALEILAAAVETGLERRTVRSWVRQRKKATIDPNSPSAESIPSASRAIRKQGSSSVTSNSRTDIGDLTAAAQLTEFLNFSTMTIGTVHPANAHTRSSTPPAPRRSSARLSARYRTSDGLSAGDAQEQAMKSPTFGYIPEVLKVLACQPATHVSPTANDNQEVEDEDRIHYSTSNEGDIPQDSSIYMINQLARKLALSTGSRTQDLSFQPSLASTSYAPANGFIHGSSRNM